MNILYNGCHNCFCLGYQCFLCKLGSNHYSGLCICFEVLPKKILINICSCLAHLNLKFEQNSIRNYLLKDLPLGVKSPYPSVDKSKPKFVDYEPISKRPILLSAEVFARNRAAKGNMDKMSTSLDYLDMEDPPNFDDFMYLRWEENTPPSSKGTPPPPYSILGSSLSNQNYIKMLGREKLKTRLWAQDDFQCFLDFLSSTPIVILYSM